MLVLALIVLPLVVVAVVAARRGPSNEPWVAPAFGVVAVAAAAALAYVSFSAWDAPDAARIGIPLAGVIAWVLAVAFGLAALARGQRTAGAAALLLALAAIAGLVGMTVAAY